MQKRQFDLVTDTLGNARGMVGKSHVDSVRSLGLNDPDLDPLIVNWASAALASPDDEWAAVRPLAQAT
jgi:hypothetical protein